MLTYINLTSPESAEAITTRDQHYTYTFPSVRDIGAETTSNEYEAS